MSDAKQLFIDEVMRLAYSLASSHCEEAYIEYDAELKAFLQDRIGEPVATTCFPDPDDERDGVRFSLADWARLNNLPSGTKLYRLDGGNKDE